MITHYERIPHEMTAAPHWVIWNVEAENPKKPYNPLTLKPAEANNPDTWSTFDKAVSVATQRGYGIGFEFGKTGEPSGFAGIDIDHCIKDGKLSDMAKDIVSTMDSYTEYSPSGDGLHIIFQMNAPLSTIGTRKKTPIQGQILEMYDNGRYFTVTGKVYGELKAIGERTEALRAVYKKYMPKEEAIQTFSPVEETKTVLDLSDEELKTAMFSNPDNGRDIERLFDGDTSKYGADPSAADLALCNHLAFYTGNDASRIDRLFRASGLMRWKWDEKHSGTGETYGAMTIAKAIKGTHKSYDLPSTNGGKGTKQIRTPKPERPNQKLDRNQTAKQTGKVESNQTESLLTVDESKETGEGATIIAELDREAISEGLNDFLMHVTANQRGQGISTGFENLDEVLDGGLYEGLYVIGANSSIGKTSLTLQIADNIARSGQTVLMISLEMARQELVAKILSRVSFTKSLDDYQSPCYAKTTRDVLLGRYYNSTDAMILAQSVQECDQWGKNLRIVEGVGDVGVADIRDRVVKYIEYKKVRPVVVIDYLQILALFDLKMTDKQNTDRNITELKRLSRDCKIPILAISSFNRESYAKPVSMASFKESGAVEYSSDVLIGLQYVGWDFEGNESDKQRQVRLNEITKLNEQAARDHSSQDIQAKILKNRNGICKSVYFSYFPAYNCFRAMEVEGNV